MNTGFLLNNVVDWEYVGHTEVPPRSRLYFLEPVGIGTPMVESLTSYICRLAAAHNVTPWMLMSREVAPLATVPTLMPASPGAAWGKLTYSVFGKQASSSLVSNGRVAADAVSVLEQLTKRSGLERLTTLFTDGVLSSRDLVSSRQQWCPECLQSWLDSKQPIYLPLIWGFQHIKVCHVHHRELVSVCPHCERPHPLLSRWLVPGFCPRCLNWMGNASPAAVKAQAEDLAIAKHVGQLLVEAPVIQADGKGGWSRSIQWIIANWFKHAEGFAHDIGLHPSSVRNWLTGSLPSLTSVLNLALQLRVEPIDLLLGHIGRFETLEPRSSLDLQPVGEMLKRHHRKHDMRKLEESMNQAVLATDTPPPSLASISRQTGAHISFLSRKFPSQAGRIKSRYAQYRRRQQVSRLAEVSNMVHLLVEQMISEGRIVGTSSLRKMLPPGYMARDSDVMNAWRKELKLRNLRPNKSH